MNDDHSSVDARLRPVVILCPRCGYDQRGVMETWTDSCPLQGTCSECGLRWRWASLFDPRASIPSWNVESNISWRGISTRSLKTALMMLQPWRFWSDLQMVHPFQPRKIFAASSLILGATAVIILAVGAVTGIEPWFLNSDWFGNVVIAIVRNEFRLRSITGLVVLLFVAVFMPVGFLAMPMSLRLGRVRYSHIWRIGAYSLIPFIPALLLVEGLRFALLSLGRNPAIGPWVELTRAIGWWIVWIGIPLCLCTWWAFAVRHYLKLGHAIGVAIALFAQAALFVALALAIATVIQTA